MPSEVGVLELQIRDNAEQAGTGLDNLADALSRVKTAVGKGIGLGTVGTQVATLAKTVNEAVGTSKVLTQLTALFNAITGFSKIKQINLNAESFRELKEAVSGFTIGNTGSQLKAMQEALGKDWNSTNATASISAIAVVANSLKINDTAMKLGTVTDAMKKFAAAYKALPDKTKKMNDIIKQMSDSIYGDRVKEIAGDVQARVEQIGTRNKSLIPLKLQQFGGLDKKQVDGQAQSEIDGLMQEVKAGFQDVNTIISKATDSVKQFKGEMKTVGDSTGNILSQFGLINQQFLGEGFSTRMKDGFSMANEAAEIYANRISNVVLPKVQKISSEEMMIAYNAREATNAINRLLGRLNHIENPKGKGFDQMVNLATGITRGSASLSNSGESSGKFFMENLDYIEKVEQALDSVVEKEREIKEAAEQTKSLVDLSKIPASGKFGEFADASKEFEHLNAILEESKKNLQFWEETYNKVQKQIRYNGATEERTNALGHAQNGYMLSIDEIDHAEKALAQFNEYIADYTTKIEQAKQATTVFNNSTQAIKGGADVAERLANKLSNIVQLTDAWKSMSMDDKKTVANIYSKDMLVSGVLGRLQEYKGDKFDQFVSGIKEIINSSVEATDKVQQLYNLLINGLPGTEAVSEASQPINEVTESAIKARSVIERLIGTFKNASVRFRRLNGDATGLAAGIKAMFPTLTGMIKRFGQIARYRMLRAVLKNITAGFTEGVENVYHYSKIVGTDLAPAMDAAATSFQQLKNSVGAAVAPLIQAFVPTIQQVISVVIEGINYLNQFFAMLNGQKTWTRALPEAAEAYDNTAKNAKAASKATKEMLAAWDELNIITSQSGGSDGTIGGHTTDEYKNMFEEVSKYDETIKHLVDGIKDQFGDVWSLAKKIGSVILGWKVSNAFKGIMGTLGSIFALGGIIDLVFNVTTMFDNQYFETKQTGWVVADILTTALGASLANKVIANTMGKTAGKYAAGITLTVSAIADVVALAGNTDVDALSFEGIFTAVKSGLKLGSGFLLFAKAAGVPTAEAIAAAGGIASIGIGAAIAIKAVAEAVQTGEITFETVKKGVAGAVAAGLGVTVFEMLGGATFGTAIAAGGAAALFIGAGFAVALGIVALINKENVEWGKISLTDEEVQAFVNTKMFTVSVPITVSIIDESLTGVKDSKTDVETKLTEALGTLNVIKLGVAKDEDYTELAKEILGEDLDGNGGVVGAVNKYIDEAKRLGKLTLQFTPSLVGTETKDASEWFSTYTTGWDTVNKFVKDKGTEIGKLLTTEEGKAIVESTPDVLAALMQQVTDVTNAITSAQISSEAFANMQVTIGDLDKTSYDKVITAYSDYIEQLTQKETALVSEQYMKQAELVAGLIAVGADPEKDPLKSAIEQYKYMGEHINDAIEEGVEKQSRPGAQLVAKFLADHYKDALDGFFKDLDVNSSLGYIHGLEQGAFSLDSLNDTFIEWLRPNNRELAETIEKTGLYAWNVFDDDTKSRIRQAMETAFGSEATAAMIEKWERQVKDSLEESIQNATGNNPVETPIELEPVVEESELQKKIKEALKSGGIIDWDEELGLANTFGAAEYLEMVKKMNLGRDKEGHVIDMPATPTIPIGTGVTPTGEIKIDGTEMANSVRQGSAGLQSSTNEGVTLLTSINNYMRILAANSRTPIANPAAVGMATWAAQIAAARVTGEVGP